MAKDQLPNKDQLLASIEKNLSIEGEFISDSRLGELLEDGDQLILSYGADPVIAPTMVKLVETLAAKKLPANRTKNVEIASIYIMMAGAGPMSLELEEGLAKLLPSIFKKFAEADVAESMAAGVSRDEAYEDVVGMLESTGSGVSSDGPLKKAVAALSLTLKNQARGLTL